MELEMKRWEITPLKDVLNEDGTTSPAPRPDCDFEDVTEKVEIERN